MKCGGAMKKMAKGGEATNKLNNAKGFAKPQTGGSNTKMGLYGIPNAGPTGNNLSGTYSYKKGGAIAKAKFGATTPVKASCKKGEVRSASGGCVSERPKFAKGGSTFGMLSVKAGVDKNPKPTAADRIAGAKMAKKKIGGSVKKYQNGGVTVTNQKISPNDPYEVQKRKLQQDKIDITKKRDLAIATAKRKREEAGNKNLKSKLQLTGKMAKGGSTSIKYQNGGTIKSTTKPVAKPKPKYVYGEVPGIGGPAAGQAATPGETILMDQKLAAERKAKAAAAKRKAEALKKGK